MVVEEHTVFVVAIFHFLEGSRLPREYWKEGHNTEAAAESTTTTFKRKKSPCPLPVLVLDHLINQ
jgi:hypothetical protein